MRESYKEIIVNSLVIAFYLVVIVLGVTISYSLMAIVSYLIRNGVI